MGTKASIEFDFQKAKRQADQLDQLANRLSNISSNLFAGTMQDISFHWMGQNANNYLAKGRRLQGNMETTAVALHRIANDIRNVARRMYDAEMKAVQITEIHRIGRPQ